MGCIRSKTRGREFKGDFGLRIAVLETTIRTPQFDTRSWKSRRAFLSKDALPAVQLFTDGACSGNPGPGGWAFILRHPATGKDMERWGGEVLTTNNKMELTAAVRGLEALKRRSHVELLTDSVYVGKGMSEWLPKWKANGWRRKERNKLVPIANEELWRELDALLAKHKVHYTRVAGHSGHPENDRVDELAVAAYQQFL